MSEPAGRARCLSAINACITLQVGRRGDALAHYASLENYWRGKLREAVRKGIP